MSSNFTTAVDFNSSSWLNLFLGIKLVGEF
jgi:hypothetical protein